MKKAQTEIIGLMVIVILFIFGGLIYIMFIGNSDGENVTRDLTQSAKVQNVLDSFIQLTPCHMKVPFDQMDKIIKDCYISDGTGMICGTDCKPWITEKLTGVMAAYNPNQDYIFKIIDKNDAEFLKIGTTCSAETRSTPTATERILAARETLTLRLTYCMK